MPCSPRGITTIPSAPSPLPQLPQPATRRSARHNGDPLGLLTDAAAPLRGDRDRCRRVRSLSAAIGLLLLRADVDATRALKGTRYECRLCLDAVAARVQAARVTRPAAMAGGGTRKAQRRGTAATGCGEGDGPAILAAAAANGHRPVPVGPGGTRTR